MAGAVAHFERAVELAPQFSEAWNHLGTIAYQSRDYPRAESCFRKALDADPEAFQPLVNLGGVSINLGKFEEALQYNLYAALTRPNDALANSQLGMSYFYLGKLDLAAEVSYRRQPHRPRAFLASAADAGGNRPAPAGPGRGGGRTGGLPAVSPGCAGGAAKIKEKLAQLRAQSDPAQLFAATGMARTFSRYAGPRALTATRSAVRQDGRYYLQSRDRDGHVRQSGIDATIGSGRHVRMLLSRTRTAGSSCRSPGIRRTAGDTLRAPVSAFRRIAWLAMRVRRPIGRSRSAAPVAMLRPDRASPAKPCASNATREPVDRIPPTAQPRPAQRESSS